MYVGKESVARPVAQICDRVWLSIAEKRLRPGTRLKEEELAEIFAVSRARVRQALVILEAMKMENEIRALRAGVVRTVEVSTGQRVEQNAPLLVLS